MILPKMGDVAPSLIPANFHATGLLRQYLLPSRSRAVLEKLKGFPPVKKITTFYGTRRFITAFTSARHLSLPKPAQSSPCPITHLLKIHLSVILPFTPGSSKWLRQNFSHDFQLQHGSSCGSFCNHTNCFNAVGNLFPHHSASPTL